MDTMNNRIAELESALKEADATIVALTQSKNRLIAQMAAEYYDNGTTKTRDVAIKEVGPHAFYCELIRCIDEIDTEDAKAIINLILD